MVLFEFQVFLEKILSIHHIHDFTLANCWGTLWSKSDLTYRHPEIENKYLPMRIKFEISRLLQQQLNYFNVNKTTKLMFCKYIKKVNIMESY